MPFELLNIFLNILHFYHLETIRLDQVIFIVFILLWLESAFISFSYLLVCITSGYPYTFVALCRQKFFTLATRHKLSITSSRLYGTAWFVTW